MISIPNAEIVTQSDRILSLKLPVIAVDSVAHLCSKSKLRHNGYIAVRLELPHKPRTTGEDSQNHHLRGHEGQIADFTGYLPSEVHEVVKWETTSWPVKTIRGREVKISEADISTTVCADAIETCHRIAAELNITLREGEDE